MIDFDDDLEFDLEDNPGLRLTNAISKRPALDPFRRDLYKAEPFNERRRVQLDKFRSPPPRTQLENVKRNLECGGNIVEALEGTDLYRMQQEGDADAAQMIDTILDTLCALMDRAGVKR